MHRFLVLLFALVASNVVAAPASTASVEKLFVLMKTESLVNGMQGNMEQMMRQGMKQAVQGKELSAEQQRVLDAVPAKFTALMREELDWAKLKPQYMQIYLDTFDQSEIDGLLAFYASPAGQAFVDKMPIVIQRSIALSQSMMQSLMPKMMATIREATAEAQGQK